MKYLTQLRLHFFPQKHVIVIDFVEKNVYKGSKNIEIVERIEYNDNIIPKKLPGKGKGIRYG